MFFSLQGYALLLGFILQFPGLAASGNRFFRLALACSGALVVCGVCIARHDALLFLAQLCLLPVLFVVFSPGATRRGANGRSDD